ncbi:MAG: hypothetical protein KGJ77_02835 [Acidobacteriota bacterium]|nr:hypothetical protein [Acidobacteriota bacterium]
MILTLDIGTSVVKAAVWDEDGLRARGSAALVTEHPGPGRVEQDAGRWWPAVVEACRPCRLEEGAIEAAVLTGARQTLVPVDGGGEPLGPALVWSDRRATAEAESLAGAVGGADAVRRATGAVLDGAAPAAKIAWLAAHEPQRLADSAWLAFPRDLVLHRLTGVVATDATMASVSGMCDAEGRWVAGLTAAAGSRLPHVLAPDAVAGAVLAEAAGALGVRAGLPVVIGAGDRACEVLGAGAAPDRPMVAWGTTANVSVPVGRRPAEPPAGVAVTRAADGGWLLEGGLSAAGSLLAWMGSLTGEPLEALLEKAQACPAGADGLIVLPWLGGARAPWWQEGAGAAALGLHSRHGAPDLARAAVEGVAYDVARCLEAMAPALPGALDGLAVGGSRATGRLWLEVVTAVTGLGASRRRSGEAAMAGAALLAARALGQAWSLDHLDPVDRRVEPDPDLVRRYGELRPLADEAAAAVIGVGRSDNRSGGEGVPGT